MLASNGKNKIRQHSDLLTLFKDAEARPLTSSELELYTRVLPHESERAEAAAAAWEVEVEVVERTVEKIFAAYPYEDHHELCTAKCPRDITNTSTYAIQSMLLDDSDWYKDKLLHWLATILQAFEFPARREPKPKVMFGSAEEVDIINALPPGRQSIYETYLTLQQEYEERLSAAHFELLKPHVEIIRHVLTRE